MSKQIPAKIKREGKNFEILVDLDEALKIRNNQGNINSAVITSEVFYNLKSGEMASSIDLEKAFGTTDYLTIAEKIIKSGDMEIPAEYFKKEREQKYKQVVDFLSKNTSDPNGRPFTPDRIMNALEEAKIQLKDKPLESQIKGIVEDLQKFLPLKIEMKKIRITIPAQHTGKAYGAISQYKEKEDWFSNGDLQVVISVPVGMMLDFYDKLNSVTHGSALAEEIKE